MRRSQRLTCCIWRKGSVKGCCGSHRLGREFLRLSHRYAESTRRSSEGQRRPARDRARLELSKVTSQSPTPSRRTPSLPVFSPRPDGNASPQREPSAAPPLGLDEHEEPRLPGRGLCRRADRPRHGDTMPPRRSTPFSRSRVGARDARRRSHGSRHSWRSWPRSESPWMPPRMSCGRRGGEVRRAVPQAPRRDRAPELGAGTAGAAGGRDDARLTPEVRTAFSRAALDWMDTKRPPACGPGTRRSGRGATKASGSVGWTRRSAKRRAYGDYAELARGRRAQGVCDVLLLAWAARRSARRYCAGRSETGRSSGACTSSIRRIRTRSGLAPSASIAHPWVWWRASPARRSNPTSC